MQEHVEQFVIKQNIVRFHRLLETERDAGKRQAILGMLAEEERKLAALLSKSATA